MASIAQKALFRWEQVEILGDLERLELVLRTLDDEALVQALEEHRGKGRDRYPIRAIWNSLLAGIVFQHPSIESLRRELRRNGQLRQICGFDLCKGVAAVPSASAYSRFLRVLQKKRFQAVLEGVFERMVQRWYEGVSEFGEHLGIDGKAIGSYAVRRGKKEGDRRGEQDADWGRHEQHIQTEGGEVVQKVKRWFGFTVHIIAETSYELPVAFRVTKASCNEQPEGRALIDEFFSREKERGKRAKYFCADRGYDSTETVTRLWDKYDVKPVIAIRNQWKDGEGTKTVPGTENAEYDYKGNVRCVCPVSGVSHEMAYRGFEKDRRTLKYACPAAHYGYACAGAKKCPLAQKAIRIPLQVDRRIFTPLARSSYAWKRQYRKRTALERINSRLDRCYGFEMHTHRGLRKVHTMISLAFLVMHAMALGRLKQQEHDKLRSLVAQVA